MDAISVATPDHWHTPMAVLGLKAGKHVYVEKPSSQNPREGELLVEAQKKYGKLVQVGDQQRSSAAHHQDGQADSRRADRAGLFRQGLVRRTRASRWAWARWCRCRRTLNWDLWQGPAPRSEYKDNIHPYNWHWLRRYGTGESLNNGTHEVDICRWALRRRISRARDCFGGRYQYQGRLAVLRHDGDELRVSGQADLRGKASAATACSSTAATAAS